MPTNPTRTTWAQYIAAEAHADATEHQYRQSPTNFNAKRWSAAVERLAAIRTILIMTGQMSHD
ncbi:hypothetical protein [Rhodococcus opacus]|uniref:Uncharacterized protein n=1 Tax=Rhodococcus opacus (strain B4) TaxID=632772 RepID=C1B9A4_RHOOB|nr:hypothetical protein [Rhodococcus opacus]BAH52257.1 hypothetical protein ROP_40100 [Rhodococcus opacus B4]